MNVTPGLGVTGGPGLFPIPTGYMLANTSGADAIPYAVAIGGGSSGITINTTAITGGTIGNVLYHKAGDVVGELTTTGSGTVLVLATGATLVTPTLGVAAGTSLALGGATIGTNALAVTGTVLLNSALTYGTVTLSNSVTGTGSMVLSSSPTLVTPALGVATATSLAIGGATLGSNGLAVTGHLLLEGVTSTGATGTGKLVFDTSPVFAAAATWGVQQTTQGSLVLANTAAGAFSTTIKSSNSASAAWTLTLPTTAGSNTNVLQTDGAGVLSWAAAASLGYTQIGTVTTSGSAATVSFTGISSSDIIVVINGVSVSAGTSLTMACSTNNGGAYGSTRDIVISPNFTGSAQYGSFVLDGVKLGMVTAYVPINGFATTAFGSTSNKSASGSNFGYVGWYPNAQVNAIQFAAPGQTFVDGSIITLYGR